MPAQPTPLWQEFERHVANLYRLLGYKVQEDQILSGQQVDVVAERYVPGIGHTRIVVECKHRAHGSIPNQDVFDFISFFNAVRTTAQISSAVIVTNQRFSAHAHSAARQATGVSLIHVRDLEHAVFDLTDALIDFVHTFEAEDVFHHYVPPSGVGTLPATTNTQTFPNLEIAIHNWITHHGQGFLSIIGDFGAGKTTLLKRLTYLLAKKRLNAQDAQTPIFLPLKNFFDAASLSEFIEDSLSGSLTAKANHTIFWHLLRDGKLVILLDGFDEALTGTTIRERASLFESLLPLVASPSPAILTCRPSYFITLDEYDGFLRRVEAHRTAMIDVVPVSDSHLSNTAVRNTLYAKYVAKSPRPGVSIAGSGHLELLPFDYKQFDQYLATLDVQFQSTQGVGWNEVKLFLGDIYDLSDLMTRPILLAMISDTVILGGMKIQGGSLLGGPAELYSIYTSLQFDRDWEKGRTRQMLSARERQLFAQAMAVTMLMSGKPVVRYSDISTLVKKTMFEWDAQRLFCRDRHEQVTSDLLVCTFLTRSKDYFRFVHRSFMEFFVAQYCVDVIMKRSTAQSRESKVLMHTLPKEVIEFIGYFCNFTEGMPEQIRGMLTLLSQRGTKSDGLRAAQANLLSAVIFNATLFPSLSCSDEVFVRGSRVKRNQSAVRWDLRRAHFVDAKLVGLSLEECRISGSFDGTEWADGVVVGGELDLDVRRSSLRGLQMKNSKVALRTFDSDLQALEVRGSTMDVAGGVRILQSKIFGTRMIMRLDGTSKFAVRDSVFEDAQLEVVFVDVEALNSLEDVEVWHANVFKDCLTLGMLTRNIDESEESIVESGVRRFVVETARAPTSRFDGQFILKLKEDLFCIRAESLGDVSARLSLRRSLISSSLGRDSLQGRRIREYFKAIERWDEESTIEEANVTDDPILRTLRDKERDEGPVQEAADEWIDEGGKKVERKKVP